MQETFLRDPGPPHPGQASLEAARRMDHIEALLAERDHAAAEQALHEALAEGLDHPRAFHLAARLALVRGGRQGAEEALPWLERALSASPGWFEPRLDLAFAYLALDRPATAEAVFGDLDRLFPEHPAGPYGRGWISLIRNRTDEARQLIDEALRRDGDYPPALLAASRLAAQDRDAVRERLLLERYLVFVGDDARAQRLLAERHQADGRLEDARRAYERAWELARQEADARSLAELARRRGDAAAAAAWEAAAAGGG